MVVQLFIVSCMVAYDVQRPQKTKDGGGMYGGFWGFGPS